MLSGILGALLVCAVTLLTQQDAEEKNNEAVVKFDVKFDTAEKAWIVKTKIEGYLKDTKISLQKAIEAQDKDK